MASTEVRNLNREKQSFSATLDDRGDRPTVIVRGEIDVATADEFERTLNAASRAGTDVVIDLSDTSFMDSTGLSVLVRVAAVLDELGEGQRRLIVDSPCVTIHKTLVISGLDRLVTITNPAG